MKFEDIKVGDTVISIRKCRDIGWGNYRNFNVESEVTKVTPKRFEIEGSSVKYKKEDGREVGDHWSRVFNIGEESAQTSEMMNHIKRVNCYHKVTGLLDRREVDFNVLQELNLDDMNELCEGVYANLVKFNAAKADK